MWMLSRVRQIWRWGRGRCGRVVCFECVVGEAAAELQVVADGHEGSLNVNTEKIVVDAEAEVAVEDIVDKVCSRHIVLRDVALGGFILLDEFAYDTEGGDEVQLQIETMVAGIGEVLEMDGDDDSAILKRSLPIVACAEGGVHCFEGVAVTSLCSNNVRVVKYVFHSFES